MITLVSQEGVERRVSLKSAKMSQLVETLLAANEENEEANKDTEIKFSLPNIRADILALVFRFCEHYIDDPMTPFEKVCFASIFVSSFPY